MTARQRWCWILRAALKAELGRAAAEKEAAKLKAAQDAATAIRAGFPAQLARQMRGLSAEQRLHAALISELSSKALDKLVALYV